ncbi:MAG: HAMP domain-containing histidine kinase [Desulfatitalea sp.]|nr:HAMP domain-containing histidine kinase [Desulfatitalea sp.]
MYRPVWFKHPILIFIFSIVAVTTSLVLYIYWYVEVSTGLDAVIRKANIEPGQALASQTWVVILVLSILVAIILLGLLTIFAYNQKTFQLLRLQRNFINNFTHELKTPVTSLKLYLQTLEKHELERNDQRKYIGYMIHDTDRLANQVNRILNLARIESKTFKAEFLQRNLVSVVEQFCVKNRHIFSKGEIQIHNPSNRSFYYAIDISLFEMLLMNLMANAFKYNGAETPRVLISFVPGAHQMLIRFEDNGIGIPHKELKRIFRKFYQLGQSENMSAKGSGLGLYLVDIIVRMHKGRIKAESEGIGHGSVFTVMLPIKEEK